MDETYKNMDCIDEWGCATLWSGFVGCEYNYCIDGDCNSSAIYLMKMDGDYAITDHDTFQHYAIEWNDSWKENLEEEMEAFLSCYL